MEAASTFEGIVECEAGFIVDCDEQYAHMLGRSATELKGMTVAELIAPEDRERVLANIHENSGVPTMPSLVRHRTEGSRTGIGARNSCTNALCCLGHIAQTW